MGYSNVRLFSLKPFSRSTVYEINKSCPSAALGHLGATSNAKQRNNGRMTFIGFVGVSKYYFRL